MSSGRSSHVAACFSLERTKYLMLSKSIADEVRAPGRHGLAVEELEALQAQVEHPLRLALLRGDVADDLLAQAALGGRAGDVGVGPAEVVAADALELGVALVDGGHEVTCSFVFGGRGRAAVVPGMQVVQTPSPWAIVASRCTWRPSTRLIASVSASHSWGNSWATWETGQCCWHSCSPTGHVAHRRGVPLVGEDLGQDLGRARAAGSLARTSLEPLLDERHPAGREFPDRVVAAGLGEEAQRLDGEVVVLLVEAVAAGLGQREDLGRAAAAAGAPGCAARGPRRRRPRAAGRGGGGRRPGSGRAARRGPPRWRVR